MDEIALSAPPAQRDDGHGGDSGGQRRRGEESAVVVFAIPTQTSIINAIIISRTYHLALASIRTSALPCKRFFVSTTSFRALINFRINTIDTAPGSNRKIQVSGCQDGRIIFV